LDISNFGPAPLKGKGKQNSTFGRVAIAYSSYRLRAQKESMKRLTKGVKGKLFFVGVVRPSSIGIAFPVATIH
jgi:ABC-type thiamine transport system substrate-binding protein